jgi:hypothetical protein
VDRKPFVDVGDEKLKMTDEERGSFLLIRTVGEPELLSALQK